ncbi:MAG: hypothetical protein WC334_02130 [Kiritimatiellales bacterium]|jgi:hypothetical protein
MTIKWITTQGVESDEGFVFQRMHRFWYHYIEGDHVLKIDVEQDIKNKDVYFESRPKWEAPFTREAISREKAAVIRCRVEKALKFMGGKYKIHEV